MLASKIIKKMLQIIWTDHEMLWKYSPEIVRSTVSKTDGIGSGQSIRINIYIPGYFK